MSATMSPSNRVFSPMFFDENLLPNPNHPLYPQFHDAVVSSVLHPLTLLPVDYPDCVSPSNGMTESDRELMLVRCHGIYGEVCSQQDDIVEDNVSSGECLNDLLLLIC